jgi:transposase
MNQMRALLLERGITVPKGRRKLEQHVAVILDSDDGQLSPRIRSLIAAMWAEWEALDRRIEAFDDEFAIQARTNDAVRRLATIPGNGVLNATALVAAVGNATTFARGRDLAAWLGLVPRQSTTGGKPHLVGISKRGTKYPRKLLIHGARAALPWLSASTTPLGKWLQSLLERAHKNTAVAALANKLARIAWAVLRRGMIYNAAADSLIEIGRTH